MFWSKKPKPTPPSEPPVLPAVPPVLASVPPVPPVLPATPPSPSPALIPLGRGHPGVFDGPKNPLEAAVVAFRARTLPAPQFLEALFNSQVYVLPLAKDLEDASGGGLSLARNPTLFCMKYPEYSALGIYTSQERAKPTSDLHPEFRFAAQVQAGEFLLGLTGDFGLVINPYWDVNLEWTNQQVTRILAMMKRE